MKRNQIIIIVAILSLLILFIGILVAWNTPATGFEPSIYTATPLIFWIAVSLNLILGIIIVVLGIPDKQCTETGHNLLVIGFTLVFLAFATIASLFIIRGYVLWAIGDPLTHIGDIKNIISTGYEAQDSIYPASKIFVAQISLVCNIDPTYLSKVIPFIFALLNVPFFYCLAKAVLPKRGQVILATLITMTFLQGWYLLFTPNTLGSLMFPLALFLLVKSLTTDELIWKFSLLLMIFLYPIFHPVPSIALLLTLFTFWPSWGKTNAFYQNSHSHNTKRLISHIIALIFLSVWMMIWFSSFGIWDYTIHNLASAITGKIQNSLNVLQTNINLASQYKYSVSEMFVKTYGGIVVLILLTIIALFLLWKKINADPKNQIFLKFTFPLLTFAIIVVILYIVNLNIDPNRFIVYIVIIATLGSGITLYEIITGISGSISQRIVGLLIAVILIIGLFSSGILILYPSKYVLQNNYQITQSEITGMNWFLNTKDKNIEETTINDMQIFRFADLLLTPEQENQREDIYYGDVPTDLQIKPHFGYNEFSNLGQEYNQDLYLLIDPAVKSIYEYVIPKMAPIRFQAQDYSALDNDFTVDKTYTDSGLDIYYIQSLTN